MGVMGEVSDGHHTFNELYAHRRALTAALAYAVDNMCSPDAPEVWRSKEHHPEDGPMFEGNFIVGFTFDDGSTLSYHYGLEYWDEFAHVEEHAHAPKYDGHTPDTTITRLLAFAKDGK
jgi:hypothetical protein